MVHPEMAVPFEGAGRQARFERPPARCADSQEARPDAATALKERPRLDSPWVTIVWNDPVNLMSYVAYVFQSYFGYPRKKAESLMRQVHEDGRSVVSSGTREDAERDTAAMHEYGLWATFTQDGPRES